MKAGKRLLVFHRIEEIRLFKGFGRRILA